jgi:8-oxo-dGTP diphosphatase
MSEMAFPRVGVGVICLHHNRLLMVKRVNAHGSGTWSTPGGHLDFGESPESCALRELTEETGVLGIAPRIIALTNDIFPTEGKHYITIWVRVEHASGEASLTAPDESSEVKWFDWDNLPQPLFIPLQNLLKQNPLILASD